ncbi:DNA methyltransferase [Sphingobacterium sp. BN32]|uniref:class I SAM-dependent DNA methyltransferase n=1 Tax=Sphingobacterium sp. BN32 TaxID=3058432 RepID=UPI00265CF6F2|nr:DNA methyltransferase [Sphingobacterium sp. BN32]WKK60361.1 N-6 DNA methylase [Sphingobacterium sp. BN32]
MKKSEIRDKLAELTQLIDHNSFIYDFLSCFGLSKTTIARLRKGDYNLSKVEGELFYKGKIFFKAEESEKLIHTIDELSKDDKILKQKPRFIIVTDFEQVLATDTKLKTNKEFPIVELADQIDFFLPLSGAEIYRVSTDDKADRDAAYKLAELYDLLVIDNPDWVAQGSHQLNLFLSRLLFCYFAEDTGIFSTKSIFTEALANNTNSDGSDVAEFLSILFKKLNTETGDGGGSGYLERFPYVNGGLFRDEIICPKFSQKSRQILLDSGELDWSEINPDIFGSMIQAVADPSERTNLGMHYTSLQNILKLIKPLFLDELYEDFEKHKENPRALERLLIRLAKIKFFDPACGSGNFLIITYKELRNLEIQIIKQLIDLDKSQRKIYFTSILLTQFYGIEIKDFAHEMAILSLWLAEHQMNQVFETELLDYGQSKPILPLKEAGNIVQGNAARMNWEEVCPRSDNDEIYIIGNPPYLGSRNQDTEQKSDMKFVFRKDYKSMDYVSIWFYKGAKYIEGINAQLAFVSTNSICQGEQVALIWKRFLNAKIEVGFAYQSFKWVNNAKGNAGVMVIIVGLRNKSPNFKILFTDTVSKEVKNINAYLLDAPDIFITGSTKPIFELPLMIYGNMPLEGGFLRFSEEEKKSIIQSQQGIEKFIKKVVGGEEFIKGQNRYCFWIEDKDLDEALSFDEICKRINLVRDFRTNGGEVARTLVKKSHQFRYRHMPTYHQFVIPCTSSESRDYIPIGVFDKEYVSLNSVQSVYDAEPWLFGVLHSKMHMVWVDAVGGKLETRYRYSAKVCYNTFPFPAINDKQKELITQYVFDILDQRAKYSEKTMAWMYNPETMPSGLKEAHHALDLAIERIYRLAPFHSDEERLEYLFKLYDEMSKRDTLFAKEKKTRKKK